MTKKEQAKQESVERLKGWLKPGDTVFTISRHVSGSGMSRRISLVKMTVKKGKVEPILMDYSVAEVLGLTFKRDKEGVTVGGCGMDMGFHLVYELAHTLFGDGYKLNHRWL